MKHLGNCTYDEFMAQAMKMKEPLAEWLTATGAAEIRTKHMADSEDTVAAGLGFLGELEVAAFRKCPELTRELLCLATFTDTFDESRNGEYIDAAYLMYSDRVVRDFFMLSMRPMMMKSSKP